MYRHEHVGHGFHGKAGVSAPLGLYMKKMLIKKIPMVSIPSSSAQTKVIATLKQ